MTKTIVLCFLLATNAFAVPMECTAKVTIRRYKISVDPDTLLMTAESDNGFKYRGFSTYHYSPFVRYHTYTLPGSYYNSELVVLVDPAQGDAMALCLTQNECYSCN